MRNRTELRAMILIIVTNFSTKMQACGKTELKNLELGIGCVNLRLK
jgi:hypothetical protein